MRVVSHACPNCAYSSVLSVIGLPMHEVLRVNGANLVGDLFKFEEWDGWCCGCFAGHVVQNYFLAQVRKHIRLTIGEQATKLYPPKSNQDLRKLFDTVLNASAPDHQKHALIYYILKDCKPYYRPWGNFRSKNIPSSKAQTPHQWATLPRSCPTKTSPGNAHRPVAHPNFLRSNLVCAPSKSESGQFVSYGILLYYVSSA